jgi:hypothetical protein
MPRPGITLSISAFNHQDIQLALAYLQNKRHGRSLHKPTQARLGRRMIRQLVFNELQQGN